MATLRAGRAAGLVAVLLLFTLLLASLVIMSDATQNSARFGRLYSLLLLFNAIGLLALAGLMVQRRDA